MAYATQTQIELAAGGAARLLQIADWDGDDVVDTDAIAWAQLTADALIDGYARLRFAELRDSGGDATDTAAMLAANEAVYQLKVNRGQNSAVDDTAAAGRLEIYKAISTGSFRPAEPVPAASTAVRSGWRTRDDNGEDVSRTGLRGAW